MPSDTTCCNDQRPLPNGWRWARLGDLCNLVNGDAYKESDWSREGVPIIRIQNLNDPAKPFNYWAGKLDGRVLVESGDVLLAWSGTPGTSFGAHKWERGLGMLNQHIFRLDFHSQDPITPDWAIMAVNHQLEVLIGRAHGAVGLRHVTRPEVESLAIPLPPLAEQKRITAILNEQMAAVERARAAAEAQLKAAKALPAACLRAVFDSPEAREWPRKLLADLSDLLPARSIATDGDTEVQAITTACLTETGFVSSGIKKARMWADDAAKCLVSAGEVLIARSNTPELVGRVAMFNAEPWGVVASDLTIRIGVREGLSSEFLTSYLSFLYLTGYWKERAGGASGSMKKITRSQIQAKEVPVPPLDVQMRFAAVIQRRIGAAYETRRALEGEVEAINEMAAALLRRAFSGEM